MFRAAGLPVIITKNAHSANHSDADESGLDPGIVKIAMLATHSL